MVLILITKITMLSWKDLVLITLSPSKRLWVKKSTIRISSSLMLPKLLISLVLFTRIRVITKLKRKSVTSLHGTTFNSTIKLKTLMTPTKLFSLNLLNPSLKLPTSKLLISLVFLFISLFLVSQLPPLTPAILVTLIPLPLVKFALKLEKSLDMNFQVSSFGNTKMMPSVNLLTLSWKVTSLLFIEVFLLKLNSYQ